MASLALPAEQELIDAATYLANIGQLWEQVDLALRREIVLALFEAILEESRPEAAFQPLIQSLGGNESGDPDGSQAIPTHYHPGRRHGTRLA